LFQASAGLLCRDQLIVSLMRLSDIVYVSNWTDLKMTQTPGLKGAKGANFVRCGAN